MKSNELKKRLIQMDADQTIDESDIDWIIVECSGIKRAEIEIGKELSCDSIKKAEEIMKVRLTGVPLAYCLGYQNFFGRNFFVNRNTLIPRCETEQLVDSVLKTIKCGSGLDVGTGSGIIPITLNLENSDLTMTAVDISDEALLVADKNAKNLNANVDLLKSDLFSMLKGKQFDFIVSNPPYIKTQDIETLDDVVKKFEPMLALDGGVDGLDFYKRIISDAPKYLKENGHIFFEVGIGESDAVKDLLSKEFKEIKIEKDLENVARIVSAIKK